MSKVVTKLHRSDRHKLQFTSFAGRLLIEYVREFNNVFIWPTKTWFPARDFYEECKAAWRKFIPLVLFIMNLGVVLRNVFVRWFSIYDWLILFSVFNADILSSVLLNTPTLCSFCILVIKREDANQQLTFDTVMWCRGSNYKHAVRSKKVQNISKMKCKLRCLTYAAPPSCCSCLLCVGYWYLMRSDWIIC